MQWTDLFTLQNALYAIGLVIAVIAGVAIYIAVNAPKKAQKTATLYNEWSERLMLPSLTKNASLNSQAIQKFFKIIWPKKFPEALNIRQEITNLTQNTALEFASAANTALQPKKSPFVFIYDVDDAKTGYLRLTSVLKTGKEFKLFQLSQSILLLVKEVSPIAEFSHIDLADDVNPDNVSDLQNFILRDSTFSTYDAEAGSRILRLLRDKFGGVWLVSEVADDTLLFRRQTEDDVLIKKEIPVESNPFKAKIEAKRISEESEAAKALQDAQVREQSWHDAEEKRKGLEIQARNAAIDAGDVSKYVNDPFQFLASAVEIAADEAGLLTLDDEPEIVKSDGIGSPILFCVYSDEVLYRNDPKVKSFSDAIINSLSQNLGGLWTVEFADASLTFRRGL